MTDQLNIPAGGRRRTRSQGAHRPPSAATFERTKPFAMELSSLGGAALSPGTVLALLRLLVRAARLLRQPHRREPW